MTKKALLSTELTDKVCWLLSRKSAAFQEIRSSSLRLLMALISIDTIDRIVINMKGRIKNLVVDRDGTLVFASLKLLQKILELDSKKRILDFELVQNLVLNLDHASEAIFSETMDLLSHHNILDDTNYLKVIFTTDALSKLMEFFPRLQSPERINFCLTVIFDFTYDSKNAGTLMSKGGRQFYTSLHLNLLNGDQPVKLKIMKIIYQLLKFASKSGPLDLFPDWNVYNKFLNLNFGELGDKDFPLFSQAVLTLLKLSGYPKFLEKVNCIEMFRHFHEAITKKHYGSREQEMKNIILEVGGFSQSDCAECPPQRRRRCG